MDKDTVTNLLSGYKSLATTLIGLLGQGGMLRVQMDSLGITNSFPNTSPGPALSAMTFPIEGHPQLQSAQDVVDVILALEKLQDSLGELVRPNTPHMTAISRIAGGVANPGIR